MKASLIFTSLIFLAACMGCSDSLNILGPQGLHKSAISDQKTSPLVWSKDELTVRASVESIVENKCAYANEINNEVPEYYGIEFDVSTNANKFINGYMPIVEVSKDEGIIFQSSGFPTNNGVDISHVRIRLDNTGFSTIKFYIALMQGDNVPAGKVPVTTLTLSNIAVYRIH